MRKSLRLRGYDYCQSGFYFLTICTAHHSQLLWRRGAQCASGAPQLSIMGQVVDEAIRSIPIHYPNVRVERYVVMPNHIHLILSLHEADGRTLCAPTISRITKQLKEAVTKHLGRPIWQKGFYDHIIRGEADYLRIWDYIDRNPAQWREDCYYKEE